MNKYYKNFILCGGADFHCLLCVEFFSFVSDVEKHIRWVNHRNTLKAQTYVAKYRKDFIYKVAKNFYCEVCNTISPNKEDLITHITSEEHVANKADPDKDKEKKVECKRDSGFIIAYDIIFTKDEWHVVINKRCLICDVTVNNLDKHVQSYEHLFKLVQAKIVNENQDQCYRKINAYTVYCLLCKKIVAKDCLAAHWEEKGHVDNKEAGIGTTSKVSGPSKQNENMKQLMAKQKVLYDINVIAGVATCKQCGEKLKIRLSEMVGHQDEHAAAAVVVSESESEVELGDDSDGTGSDKSTGPTTRDHGKRRATLAKFGKRHQIRLNEGAVKAYCYVCHVPLAPSSKAIVEHVRGWQHKGLLEHRGLVKPTRRDFPVYKTEPLKRYLTSVFHSPSALIVWVNLEFCIDNQSFLLVAPSDHVSPSRKTICYACNMEYKSSENEKHLKTARHKYNFVDAEVVTTLEGEFIRELSPNLYHCGFCNRLIAYFDNVLRHFRNWVHHDNRNSKNLTSRIVQKCMNDNVMAPFSTNPDLMYLQLIDQGLFTGVPKLPARFLPPFRDGPSTSRDLPSTSRDLITVD